MSKYGLTREYFNHIRVSLTKADADRYLRADKMLTLLLDIEESYDVVTGNYLDFEKLVLGLIAEDAIHGFSRRASFDDSRRACHRHLSNLLFCGRNFMETLKHSMGLISTADGTWVEAALSQQYDDYFAYRLMEALRNHVAHIGRAVSGVGFDFQHGKTPAPGAPKIIHSMQPTINATGLADYPKFNRGVLDEIRQSMASQNGKPIDLVPVVRRYVTSLSTVLVATRERLSAQERTWSADISEAAARMDAADVDARWKIGLQVVFGPAVGKRTDKRVLFPEDIQRIAALREHNPAKTDLSRLEITR